MWMKDTRATRISATVFHKHKYITNPSVTPEDHVIATAGKLAAELKGRMATHLGKTDLHQLERLGTILKQGWTHPENSARSPPIPNKHPSTSPSSGPTEIPKETPIPYPDLHHIPFSNHRPVYITKSGSISKFPTIPPTTSPSSDPTQKQIQETSMARPEHVTKYRSSLITTPQLPRKAKPPRVAPPPRVEHPATPQQSPKLVAQRISKKYTKNPPTYNTRSKKAPMKSSTR